jgi:hypothetical protein
MKRAIYVGKGLSAVSYGMTGTMQPSISPESPYFAFRPDGKIPGQWFVMRKDLYVASEDQTKYYPKHP